MSYPLIIVAITGFVLVAMAFNGMFSSRRFIEIISAKVMISIPIIIAGVFLVCLFVGFFGGKAELIFRLADGESGAIFLWFLGGSVAGIIGATVIPIFRILIKRSG